jgi:hypothetical protein
MKFERKFHQRHSWEVYLGPRHSELLLCEAKLFIFSTQRSVRGDNCSRMIYHSGMRPLMKNTTDLGVGKPDSQNCLECYCSLYEFYTSNFQRVCIENRNFSKGPNKFLNRTVIIQSFVEITTNNYVSRWKICTAIRFSYRFLGFGRTYIAHQEKGGLFVC